MRRVTSWLLALTLLLGLLPLGGAWAEEEGAALAAAVVIDPTEYGADPTGATDSTQAIWRAFEAAKTLGNNGATPVTIQFPKGEYHLYKEAMEQREYHTSNTSSTDSQYHIKYIGLLLEGQSNVTVDGGGSLFLMHGDVMAFAVVDSDHITVKNLAWDYQVPRISEMIVVDAAESYVDYYIPAAFPYTISGTDLKWSGGESQTGEDYWTLTSEHENSYSVVAHIPGEEMTRAYNQNKSQGPFHNVASITDQGNRVVRFTYTGYTQAQRAGHGIKNGSVFQFCSSAIRPTAGGFNWESSDLRFENVTCHSTHGFGWLTQMCRDVTYESCNFMPREDGGRVATSYADGLHASGSAGKFEILNCNFSGTHDDPINMHGTFTRVEQREDDHTLVLKYIHNQQGGFPQFHAGDKVMFFTRDKLVSTDSEAEYTVAEVISNPGESGNDLKTMKVRFTETLPTTLSEQVGGQPKYVAENITYAPAVTIQGCTFKNATTRAILVTSRNKVIIKNNTFLNLVMPTLYFSNDSNNWYESGPIRDLTIEGNTFYIKSIGRTSWPYAPAIYFHPITKGAVEQPDANQSIHNSIPDKEDAIHRNVTIDGNTFYMDLDCVVKAESVSGLTITNNKILRYHPEIRFTAATPKTVAAGERVSLGLTASGKQNSGVAGKDLTANGKMDNLFEFDRCDNVTISGNTYDDGLKLTAVNYNSKSAITVTGDPITVTPNQDTSAAPGVGPVHYAVSDPAVAFISADGTLTGLRAGMVNVTAYTDWNGTVVRSEPVTVTVTGNGAGTVGGAPEPPWVLADGVEVIRKHEETLTAVDATSVTITQESGDIWKAAANSNNAKNLLCVALPAGTSSSDIVAAVDVVGLPDKKASNDWDSVNLLLYGTDDKYAGMGKKAHLKGFTSMIEVSGDTFHETEGAESHNTVTSGTLLLWKSGNAIRAFAKPTGGEWLETAMPSGTLEGDLRVCLSCWGDASPEDVTFSNLKMGKASEVSLSTDTAANAAALDAFLAGASATPLFARDTQSGPAAGTLGFLAVDGGPVRDFTPDTRAYTVLIPAGSQKVRLTFTAQGSVTVGSQSVADGTAVVDTASDTTAVTLTPAGGQAYTLTLKKAPSNNTALSTLSVGNWIPNAAGAECSFAKVSGDVTSVTLAAQAADSDATISLTRGHARTPVELGADGTAQLPLYTGLNSFFVDVTAADGVTKERHILNLVRITSAQTELSALTVNGAPLSGFTSSQTRYFLTVNSGALALSATAANSNAQVTVTLDGVETQGGTLAAQALEPGRHTAVVTVRDQDPSATRRYVLEVVADPSGGQRTEVDSTVLAQHAAANSQQSPARDNDGPVAWAFDDTNHWWHSRWSGSAAAGEVASGQPTESNPIWIQTGFGEAKWVREVSYQGRPTYQGHIRDYELQAACLTNPSATPTDADFETVQTGRLWDTTGVQHIVLDELVRATHIRLVARSIVHHESRATGSSNYVSAKRIRVYTEEKTTSWGPVRLQLRSLEGLGGQFVAGQTYTLWTEGVDPEVHQVLAAYYDAGGRMVGVRMLTPDRETGAVTLSHNRGTDVRLFLLEKGAWAPLAQAWRPFKEQLP